MGWGCQGGGNHSYLRFRLLLIGGLWLRLENVINQLSDPAKGKPPVQTSRQLDRRNPRDAEMRKTTENNIKKEREKYRGTDASHNT